VNLISLEKAAKAYAHRTLLDGVSLGVGEFARLAAAKKSAEKSAQPPAQQSAPPAAPRTISPS